MAYGWAGWMTWQVAWTVRYLAPTRGTVPSSSGISMDNTMKRNVETLITVRGVNKGNLIDLC